ncbi:MAG: F-type H+-transporting ATPase subunit b [Phycisphaerales bacterium]|jgi:F-type H+-transporting ATPase subunit b|nr:F-type H+-transporting ATPase subunit b [Phycisphaerales bacterium]
MVRIILVLLLTCWLAGNAFAADAHGDAHATAGTPEKLSPVPTLPQAIAPAVTTLIVFALLLAVLGKFAWGPISSGLKAREDKIRGDIANAEAARKRAEETLAKYNQQLATAEAQVRDILAKASQDAERIATNMKMQAQQEAEEAKQRATRDIETARKNALTDIYAQAAELSTSIAEKILRRNLTAADQRDLVESSLRQVESVGGKA